MYLQYIYICIYIYGKKKKNFKFSKIEIKKLRNAGAYYINVYESHSFPRTHRQ